VCSEKKCCRARPKSAIEDAGYQPWGSLNRQGGSRLGRRGQARRLGSMNTWHSTLGSAEREAVTFRRPKLQSLRRQFTYLQPGERPNPSLNRTRYDRRRKPSRAG